MENKELPIPEDLRSAKKNGRPSNKERSSGNAISEQIHLLSADLLKGLKDSVKNMTNSEKIALLGKLLQYVGKEEGKSEEDAAFQVLGEKYLRIKMRIDGVGEIRPTKSKGKGERKKKES